MLKFGDLEMTKLLNLFFIQNKKNPAAGPVKVLSKSPNFPIFAALRRALVSPVCFRLFLFALNHRKSHYTIMDDYIGKGVQK